MTSSKEEISLSSTEECGCILEQLILRKFDLFNYEEKLEIINNGKPTPPLPNLCYQTKRFTRHFHESHYSATPWLCGCKKTSKLYCWPCVLFADDNNVWTKKGVNDLNDISNLLKNHSLSKTHMNSALSLVKFRNANIDIVLKKTSREESRKSNEIIKNNRHVIDRLIDATCYLVDQDLNFENSEEKTSFQIKNFNELVNMLANTDPILKHHLNHTSVFTLASNNIQNDLIESIAESLNNEIRKEVMETPFLSIILGGYVDINNKTICSVIFRYVTNENGVCERFIKFLEINKERTELSIANNLLTLVNQFQCTNKVVAHSFDGAVISVEKRGSLQKLINSTYKEAIYVPYHAHHLNFIIIQSLSNIKECRQFFETLISVHNFFTKSPKRATILELMTKRSFPSAPSTSTNIINSIVDLIMHLKEELIEVFKRMDNSEEWDLDTCSLARGYYLKFNDIAFNFLLILFWKLFQKLERVFLVIQSNLYDVEFCEKNVKELQNDLKELRNNFEGMWPTIPIPPQFIAHKRMKKEASGSISNEDLKKLLYQKIFNEILDNINENLKHIFSNIDRLQFCSLLDFNRFYKYRKKFPEESINALLKYYGKHFDHQIMHLKAELMEIYSSEEFLKTNVLELFTYLEDSGLSEVLPETSKLCSLYLTMPTVSSCNLNSIDKIEKMFKILSIPKNENIFTGLSIISIEGELFKTMKIKPNFYDIIRHIFALKNQHIELFYKLA